MAGPGDGLNSGKQDAGLERAGLGRREAQTDASARFAGSAPAPDPIGREKVSLLRYDAFHT